MKVITAPDPVDVRDFFFYEPVFLAGGISGCPDWQTEFLSMFEDDNELLFLNPRRPDFNVEDTRETYKQIEWEHVNLGRAGTVIFWFPKETLCPITLFELGKIAATIGVDSKMIHVGCHPEYKRKLDVIVQLRMMHPQIQVVDNLKELADQLKGIA